MISKEWGEIIQLTGCIMVVIGIFIECIFLAPVGYVAITLGSLVFAIATKIKHRGST